MYASRQATHRISMMLKKACTSSANLRPYHTSTMSPGSPTSQLPG